MTDRQEDWISAYLDGELSPEEERRAVERIEADPALQSQIDQLRHLGEQLRRLPTHRLPSSFAARLRVEALGEGGGSGEVVGGVDLASAQPGSDSSSAAGGAQRAPSWYAAVATLGVLAATLLLSLTLTVPNESGESQMASLEARDETAELDGDVGFDMPAATGRMIPDGASEMMRGNEGEEEPPALNLFGGRENRPYAGERFAAGDDQAVAEGAQFDPNSSVGVFGLSDPLQSSPGDRQPQGLQSAGPQRLQRSSVMPELAADAAMAEEAAESPAQVAAVNQLAVPSAGGAFVAPSEATASRDWSMLFLDQYEAKDVRQLVDTNGDTGGLAGELVAYCYVSDPKETQSLVESLRANDFDVDVDFGVRVDREMGRVAWGRASGSAVAGMGGGGSGSGMGGGMGSGRGMGSGMGGGGRGPGSGITAADFAQVDGYVNLAQAFDDQQPVALELEGSLEQINGVLRGLAGDQPLPLFVRQMVPLGAVVQGSNDRVVLSRDLFQTGEPLEVRESSDEALVALGDQPKPQSEEEANEVVGREDLVEAPQNAADDLTLADNQSDSEETHSFKLTENAATEGQASAVEARGRVRAAVDPVVLSQLGIDYDQLARLMQERAKEANRRQVAEATAGASDKEKDLVNERQTSQAGVAAEGQSGQGVASASPAGNALPGNGPPGNSAPSDKSTVDGASELGLAKTQERKVAGQRSDVQAIGGQKSYGTEGTKVAESAGRVRVYLLLVPRVADEAAGELSEGRPEDATSERKTPPAAEKRE